MLVRFLEFGPKFIYGYKDDPFKVTDHNIFITHNKDDDIHKQFTMKKQNLSINPGQLLCLTMFFYRYLTTVHLQL